MSIGFEKCLLHIFKHVSSDELPSIFTIDSKFLEVDAY